MAERERLPVQQARAGSPEAWDTLFRRYELPLYVYVFELVRHEQTSLDVVQETFINAVRHLGGLREDGKFGSWLFGIAHQKCLQHWRKQSREAILRAEFTGAPPEFEDAPDELLIRQEQEDAFMLERHRAEKPRLDAIRKDVLAGLRYSLAREPHRAEAPPVNRFWILELLLPFRWHLAGLSAAWMLIAFLNNNPSPDAGRSMARQNPPSPTQLLAALRENRRQIAELLGSTVGVVQPAVQPPAFVPKRRSEIPSPSARA